MCLQRLKMSVTLYKLDFSPPSRACVMACKIFDVPVEMIDVNIMRQEHRTQDFLKLNPVHTIPVLQDGDLVIHDSHAILMYISDMYANDDLLYPEETKQRALVNQKLFFNTSILFPRLRSIIYAAVADGVRQLPEKNKNEIEEAYGFLEEFLSCSKYLAGDTMSIADLAAITTVSTLVYVLPMDVDKYPNTQEWIKEMERKPVCEIYNMPGAKTTGEWLSSMLRL